MIDAIDEAALRRLAERRVDARLGFLIHAVIFVAVNAAMLAANGLTVDQPPSLLWSAATWGAVLLIHGLGVCFDGPGLRRRAIEAELARLAERQRH
jgi:hypothetical protein